MELQQNDLVYILLAKGECPFRGILTLYQISLFFADGQFNMCTLSWHTSARAEARLFSSYKALKVGGVIQYDSDE